MVHRLASILAVGALLAPMAAGGQTTTAGTLTITESNDPSETPVTINADECNAADQDGNALTDNLVIHWTGASFSSGDQIRIDVSNQTGCPIPTSSNSAVTQTLVPVFSGTGGTDQWPRATDSVTKVTAQQLVAAVASATISCSVNSTIYVCAVDTTATGNQANGSIALNVLPPTAPTAVSTGVGDGALYVYWTSPSGSPAATGFMIRATPTAGGTSIDSSMTVTSGARLGGLTNGTPYTVVVYAFSQFGNRSVASASATGTPQPVLDFWQQYKGDGGVEPGGCAAGSAGVLSLLLLPLALRRRRRS